MRDIFNDNDAESGKYEDNHEEVTPKTKEVENDIKNKYDQAKKDNRTKDKVPTRIVIHKIVYHKIIRNKRNGYANVGEPIYRMIWYGFLEDKDTREPTKHWPWIKVLTYYRNNKLWIPDSMEQSDDD